jgi:hypothetical protein
MSESEPQDRARLAAALEHGEARLRQLDLARAATNAHVDALRAQLTTQVPRAPSEKVALFREVFRGRSDVYPTRFVSKKTGKSGYAPACANKWEPGLCALKTDGTCSDCTNQALRPVDDNAVRDHLRGKHVMGVYPMLPDETCWLPAVDFDEGTWKDDVRAFAETARRLDLRVLLERSRSGNGAHAWFFFSEPVAAASARKMACHVRTETMGARHELSMASYGRLFPSQDTMPRGGFGNLIALPLQRGPRQDGNSAFVDDTLTACADEQQWCVLASIERITAVTVERIAAERLRKANAITLGTILGGLT